MYLKENVYYCTVSSCNESVRMIYFSHAVGDMPVINTYTENKHTSTCNKVVSHVRRGCILHIHGNRLVLELQLGNGLFGTELCHKNVITMLISFRKCSHHTLTHTHIHARAHECQNNGITIQNVIKYET